MKKPFCLGTAQLGMNYGIANSRGKPGKDMAMAIVSCALERGIEYFDTAQAYGQSEKILGELLHSCGAINDAKIITKIHLPDPGDPGSLRVSIQKSFVNIGVSRLYCLMLHDEKQLELLDGTYGDILGQLLYENKTSHVGISVYTPEGALAALRHPLISVVQIPSSIFDRRFFDANVMETARNEGKEIHIRSIFLQGVISMDPANLQPPLMPLKATLIRLRQICACHNCSPLQAALGYVYKKTDKFKRLILFGAEQPGQVSQNIDFAESIPDLPEDLWRQLDQTFPPQDNKILNPSLWGI